MKRITSIGAIFFQSDDQEKLHQWYEKHLGIMRVPHRKTAKGNPACRNPI